MKSINTLVIQKMSKLKYLQDRFASNILRTSVEYSKLSECAEIHRSNSNAFIESLRNYTQNVDIISDSFLDNDKLYNMNFNKYDMIFSLGGDGTFLRIA
jgi:NAD kinase